jgi:hypothetical protein
MNPFKYGTVVRGEHLEFHVIGDPFFRLFIKKYAL